MPDTQQQAFTEFALEVIREAGELALKYFRVPVSVDDKKDTSYFDPVTIADRAIETYIREKIVTAYPDHTVVGEEHGTVSGTNNFKWYIDPIDGTRAYISGVPMWGILLGLMQADRCKLGLMHQPFLQETFVGNPEGAFLYKGGDKQTISARDTNTLEQAILYCTHPAMFATESDLGAFNHVAAACQLMRFGGDCYAYCLLAHGFIDLVIEGNLKPYDIIPLVPIVEAAGGVVTDWKGGPATAGGNIIAAANPVLHEKALTLINE